MDDLTGGMITHMKETGELRRDDWRIGTGKSAKAKKAWTGWTEFIKKDPGWQRERGKDGSRRKEMKGRMSVGDSHNDSHDDF